MGVAVDHRGAHCKPAVFVEVIAVFSILEPAVSVQQAVLFSEVQLPTFHFRPTLGHGAVFPEVTESQIPLQPSGVQGTVVAEQVGFLLQCCKPGGHDTFVKVIDISVNFRPAQGSNALAAEMIGISVDFLPACKQGTVPEVVSAFLQPQPAYHHGAVAAEIVEFAVLFQPAGVHDAFF